MRISVGAAKEKLAAKADESVLESRLEMVCERLLLHGKFAGSVQRLVIKAPYGQLALPRGYRTAEGIKISGGIIQLTNQWWEWLPGQSDFTGYSMDFARDLGDGWAVMRTPTLLTATPDVNSPAQDFPEGGTISVAYPGGGTHVVLIEGRDTDGIPVSLTFNGQETKANVFARIGRIKKEQGAVNVTVTFTDDDAVETLLAIMEPTEMETYYRRYQLDGYATQEDVSVVAFCKRRFIPFASDNDILPFSNLSALSLGLDSVQFEAENDLAVAEKYWGMAVDILNKELGDIDADNALPPIKFLYPGGQAALRSFY